MNDMAFGSFNPVTMQFTPPGPLNAVFVTNPANGTLSLNVNGSFTYTPNVRYVGVDSFTYRASDGTATSNVATVSISVMNMAPTAGNDSYMTRHDRLLMVPMPGVLMNDVDTDGDPRTPTLVTSTSNGTLTFNTNGSFTYNPNPGFVGNDSFTYRVSDGITSSNIASVTIEVINNAPVAYDDFASIDVGRLSPINIDVLINDSDADVESLTVEILTSPSDGGSVFFDPSTLLVRYTPPSGGVTSGPLTGPDTNIEFDYRVRDTAGRQSPPAKVRINPIGKVPGPGIYLTHREVLVSGNPSGKFHTSILIVPTAQDVWAGNPNFAQAMIGGVNRWYTTISAHKSGGFAPALVSEIKYADDAPNKMKVIGTVTPGGSENALIQRLLNYDANYDDDSNYNINLRSSNSYIRGILNKDGAATPALDNGLYPGWGSPVAPAEFDAD